MDTSLEAAQGQDQGHVPRTASSYFHRYCTITIVNSQRAIWVAGFGGCGIAKPDRIAFELASTGVFWLPRLVVVRLL